MGKRREARERAVQFLFQYDLNPGEDLPAALAHFWESQRAAAIAEDKGGATWGQPQELPPRLAKLVLENMPPPPPVALVPRVNVAVEPETS